MKRNVKDWCSIVGMVGFILLLGVGLGGVLPRGARAQTAGYTFKSLAFLGDPAPGPEGGTFTVDFEPYGINDRGEVSFAADLTTGGEGVFLARKGQILQIMRSGQATPEGGTFEGGVIGHTALNAQGDVAFVFQRSPSGSPSGVNAGVYRYSHITKKPTAVMVPGTTPAPGGGVFKGAYMHASFNNRGEIVFSGIVPTDKGIHLPDQEYLGLGQGIFRADKRGRIASVVSPGDPAPGGGTFDFAMNPWINDKGDIAFGAHVAGEECIDFDRPQSAAIFCAESVYLKKAATGEIQSIAHQGDPAPGGGVYRLAFGAVLNNRGEIAFIGDLTPAPDAGKDRGVFLHSGGITFPVARPGDLMPGGGRLKTTSFFIGQYHLNERGEIAFNAILDTDDDSDGNLDTGLYVWSRGLLRLVVRTGTVTPGVGTIAHLNPPDLAGFAQGPLSFVSINNHGEVVFQATLTDGHGVLLIATPSKSNRTPQILLPGKKAYGKTYAQWSVASWQWIFSLPVSDHPLFDETGEKCGVGQSGRVWFLGGVFNVSGSATRDCTVPARKALFFPIATAECSTLEGFGNTEEELRACARSYMDTVIDMFVEVDGVSILDLQRYRVESSPFSFTMPENNYLQFFGFAAPAGTYSPAVADGVYLLLKPLPVGEHVIRFHGNFSTFDVVLDVTYHLTVAPQKP